jgi:hypothetical protein
MPPATTTTAASATSCCVINKPGSKAGPAPPLRLSEVAERYLHSPELDLADLVTSCHGAVPTHDAHLSSHRHAQAGQVGAARKRVVGTEAVEFGLPQPDRMISPVAAAQRAATSSGTGAAPVAQTSMPDRSRPSAP